MTLTPVGRAGAVTVVRGRRRLGGLVCRLSGHRWHGRAVLVSGEAVVVCERCSGALRVRYVDEAAPVGQGWAVHPVRSPTLGEPTAARHVQAMITAARAGDQVLLGELMAEAQPHAWDVIDAQSRLLVQLLAFGAVTSLGKASAAEDLHRALALMVERDLSGGSGG